MADPTNVFLLAVARGTEIALGIVCAGVVLVLTGRGTAREQAATTIADIARETGLGLRATLLGQGMGQGPESFTARRALIGRTSALSTLLDETVGESPDLRVHAHALTAAVDGLFAALSGWRLVATHLEGVPAAQAARDAAPVVAMLPPGPAIVITARASPAETRDRCRAAALVLDAVETQTQSAELVRFGTAEALRGLDRALNGVALLVEPERAEDAPGLDALRVPDMLPALLNGVRAFVIILATALWWIITAWPSGTSALLFAAIIVLLLSPRGDTAVSNAWEFLAGTMLTAALAAITDFAVLPNQEGFPRLALVLGAVLIPLAAFSTGNWRKSAFVAATTNFVPLLAPANLPAYDTTAFYNSTLAIVVGVGAGVLVISLMPQLSPEHRAERLRLLTLRDFRRLVARRAPESQRRWEGLIYGRLAALPAGSSPLAHAQIIAALYVGGAVLLLRRWAAQFGRVPALQQLLSALASGGMPQIQAALAQADTAFAGAAAQPEQRRFARAALLALREALQRHAVFFTATDPDTPFEAEGAPDAVH